MHVYKSIGLVALLIWSVSCSQRSTVDSSLSQDFDAERLLEIKDTMQTYVTSGQVSGIATMLVKDGEVVHSENVGYADIENKKLLNEQSIFRIYSMTKPIASVAFMLLYEQGMFQLDDKVSDYIPEFGDLKVYSEENGGGEVVPIENDMTIRHLFTHTSGLTYGWKQDSYVDSLYRAAQILGADETLGMKVKKLAVIPLKFQPGSKWEYSVSIDVIGYLIEKLSGMSLDDFLATNIFQPLKMNDTGFFVPKEKLDRLTLVYAPNGNGGLKPIDKINKNLFMAKPKLFSGGGGLVSTVSDYARFCQMILNYGELDGVRVLKKSTIEMVKANQMPEGKEAWEGVGFGLGFQVFLKEQKANNAVKGEISWGGAADTHFWIDFKNNMFGLAFTQQMPQNKVPFSKDFKRMAYDALKSDKR